MVRDMTQKQINKLSKKSVFLNNHKMGLTPHKFKLRKKLNKFYKIVSTSVDRKNREYVSTNRGLSLSFLWRSMASRKKF